MYRKIFLVSIFISVFFVSSLQNRAYALNPKVKVLLSTGSYGLIGGTLLGTATLAFGSESRAIAQGASIGLWTGLLFGSYIILSHMITIDRSYGNSPYGGNSPYENDDQSGGSNEVDGAGNPLERWNPYAEMKEYQAERGWASRLPQQPASRAKFYLNVLNVSF